MVVVVVVVASLGSLSDSTNSREDTTSFLTSFTTDMDVGPDGLQMANRPETGSEGGTLGIVCCVKLYGVNFFFFLSREWYSNERLTVEDCCRTKMRLGGFVDA